MSDFSGPLPLPNLLQGQVLTIVLAMGGLGMLAWELHQARGEESRLKRELGNAATLVRASLEDHAHTRRRLTEAHADKRMLQHFLSDAGQAEQELKRNLSEVKTKHDEAVLTGEQQVQAWSANGAELKASLETETSKRGDAEQLAAYFETESQRLAEETEGFQEQISRVQQENVGMLGEIGRLRWSVGSLQGENSTLRSCNDRLRGEVSGLRSEVGGLETTISGLESKISGLQGEISRLNCRR